MDHATQTRAGGDLKDIMERTQARKMRSANGDMTATKAMLVVTGLATMGVFKEAPTPLDYLELQCDAFRGLPRVERASAARGLGNDELFQRTIRGRQEVAARTGTLGGGSAFADVLWALLEQHEINASFLRRLLRAHSPPNGMAVNLPESGERPAPGMVDELTSVIRTLPDGRCPVADPIWRLHRLVGDSQHLFDPGWALSGGWTEELAHIDSGRPYRGGGDRFTDEVPSYDKESVDLFARHSQLDPSATGDDRAVMLLATLIDSAVSNELKLHRHRRSIYSTIDESMDPSDYRHKGDSEYLGELQIMPPPDASNCRPGPGIVSIERAIQAAKARKQAKVGEHGNEVKARDALTGSGSGSGTGTGTGTGARAGTGTSSRDAEATQGAGRAALAMVKGAAGRAADRPGNSTKYEDEDADEDEDPCEPGVRFDAEHRLELDLSRLPQHDIGTFEHAYRTRESMMDDRREYQKIAIPACYVHFEAISSNVLSHVAYFNHVLARVLAFGGSRGISYDKLHSRSAVCSDLVNRNRGEQAIQGFGNIIRDAPLMVGVYVGRGTALCLQGRYVDGLRDITTAIRLDPGSLDSWVRRAQLHAGLKRPAETIADLSMAVRLAPRYAAARAQRAPSLIGAGDCEAGIRDLEVSLRLRVPAVRLRRAVDVPAVEALLQAGASSQVVHLYAESRTDLGVVVPWGMQHLRDRALEDLESSMPPDNSSIISNNYRGQDAERTAANASTMQPGAWSLLYATPPGLLRQVEGVDWAAPPSSLAHVPQPKKQVSPSGKATQQMHRTAMPLGSCHGIIAYGGGGINKEEEEQEPWLDGRIRKRYARGARDDKRANGVCVHGAPHPVELLGPRSVMCLDGVWRAAVRTRGTSEWAYAIHAAAERSLSAVGTAGQVRARRGGRAVSREQAPDLASSASRQPPWTAAVRRPIPRQRQRRSRHGDDQGTGEYEDDDEDEDEEGRAAREVRLEEDTVQDDGGPDLEPGDERPGSVLDGWQLMARSLTETGRFDAAYAACEVAWAVADSEKAAPHRLREVMG